MQKNNRKILLINYEYPPLGGGGGRATQVLAEALEKKGYRVDLITSHFKGLKFKEELENLRIFRVPVLLRTKLFKATLPSLLTFPFSSSLCGLCLCLFNKYAVINTHFVIPSGPTGIFLSKLFKIRHIFSLHGSDIYSETSKASPHKNKLLKIAVTFMLKNSDKLVAQSTSLKEKILEYYVSCKEVAVTPYGFVPPLLPEKFEKSFGVEKGKFNIIALGRLVEWKGFQYLIKALALLPKDICLFLGGDGPYKNELKDLVKKLSLEERVFFLGWLGKEKFDYFLKADLFVLPSLYEAFGIVVQEAMWVGLPVVATNSGGPADFKSEGVVLVEPADEKALCAAVQKIYKNANLRKAMGEANKKYVMQMTGEKYASEYLAQYFS